MTAKEREERVKKIKKIKIRITLKYSRLYFKKYLKILVGAFRIYYKINLIMKYDNIIIGEN